MFVSNGMGKEGDTLGKEKVVEPVKRSLPESRVKAVPITSMSVERAYAQYTLHEAMKLVLAEQPERTMHAASLAEMIYARRLYVQRDGGMARPNQIRARCGHYVDLFEVLPGNLIKLRGERAAL